MIQTIRSRVAVLALAWLLVVPSAWAEDPAGGGAASSEVAGEGSDEAARKAAIEAAVEATTDEVKALLKESADFLAAQSRFRFLAHVGYDVVQLNGQKLEFGATRKVTVRRPDRIRIEVTQRDGDRRTLFFDGEQIAIDLPEEKAYVAANKPGTLDAAIDYLVDDLDTPAPLHEFFSSNLYDGVNDAILSGFYVEEAALGERRCHHLALRTAEVDAQIWIEDGDEPLPCRLVITYKREERSPQFWAQFHDWDLSPRAPDRLFEYTPPEGAEKLTRETAIEKIREEVEDR
jgi:hypothetical protein